MKKPAKTSSEKGSKRLYEIIIKPKAEKMMSKLPNPIKTKLDELIRSLAIEPRPVGCKKLQTYESTYRVRYSDYRVLYTVEDKKLIVEVISIGNRQDIYRDI